MKKVKLLVIALFMLFALSSCGGCSNKDSGNNSTTPKFDGLSLSKESPLMNNGNVARMALQDLNSSEENVEQEENEDQNEETLNEDSEYLENHKLGNDIEVPKDDMPSNTLTDYNAEDIVVPSITVTPHEQQTPFYAEVNSDVYISVSIVNPLSYVILRFKLNGEIYQNYQFESGSTSTLLVLKVNSGSVSGIKEFTIDEIKYIEDETNDIKDVIIEGGNTVKLSVGYEVSPSVSLINEGFDLTTYEAQLGVTDPNSLIDFENKTCLLHLTDGVSILETKELSLGVNNIKFDNLVLGQTYKYVVTANYDRLDEAGYSLHVLYEGDFNLSAYCKLSNISSTQDTISFDYRLLNKAATIKNIILFDSNNLPVDEWLDGTKNFKNLYSNTKYQVRLYYDVLIGDEVQTFYDSFNVTTKAYQVPTISATYKIKEAGIQFTPFVDDDNNMIISKSIKLFNQNGEFVANVEFNEGEISNLNRNANYILKFMYTYDLHDGNGVTSGENVIAFSTSKAAPKVEIRTVNATMDSIEFETIVSDPNQVGSITSVSIYDAKTNAFIRRLTNIYDREFTGLKNNTLYAVEIGYTYDLDDGNGSQVITFRQNISTAKAVPSAEISCLSSTEGVDITCNEVDPDDAGTLKKVSLYYGDELVKEVEAEQLLYTITGLLSGVDYRVVADYVYNLNNGTYDETISLVKSFKTIAKKTPIINVNAKNITESSFSYSITATDPNEICTIEAVTIKLGTKVIEELTSFENGNLSNLYSNNDYIFEVDFKYNLNDGRGELSDHSSIKVRTLKYEDANVEYKNMYSLATGIKFDYNITDANNSLNITKIELLDENGNLVQELTDLTVREFENLTESSFYTIKTTYTFDLNDGKGVQTNASTIKYGTSGADIFINSLRVLGIDAPQVGDEVEVNVQIDNPGDITLTAIWISDQRCDLLNVNSRDYSNLIVKFIPDTIGGIFDVKVTGYSYVSGGIEVTNELTTNYHKEIVILGEVAVVDYYAISDIDTKYENYSSTPFRILEIANEANYDILSIYATNTNNYGSENKEFEISDFELIDNSHILIKYNNMNSEEIGWNRRTSDLHISGLKFGLNGTTRTQKFTPLSAPQEIYSRIVHIKTVDELKNINSTNNDKNYYGYNSNNVIYILDNDLDLKDEDWTGLTGSGVFDGNGHTIKNLTIRVLSEDTNSSFYGLFANFDGMICNLTLENVYASIQTKGNVYFGAISARNSRCYGCMVNGIINVDAQSGYVVGLANNTINAEFNDYYSESDYRYSKNNYIEDLIINVTNNVKGAFVTNSNIGLYYNPVTNDTNNQRYRGYNSIEFDSSTFDTYVVGNSYVYNKTTDTYSYPAYCGDTTDPYKILVDIELSNVDYKIVTNCDIDDIEITALAISSVDVVREGYRVSWYNNSNLTGDEVTFPYRDLEKTTLYAKWERYIEANKSYSYNRTSFYKNGKNVEGYIISNFNGASSPLIIGGYYNGLPVMGAEYEAFRYLHQDEDGVELSWEETIDKVKDVVVYVDVPNVSWYNTIYAGTYYMNCKQESLWTFDYYGKDGNSQRIQSKIYTPTEYLSYYQNRYGKYESSGVYEFDFNNLPFELPYAKTNDANASITAKYIDTDAILTSIRSNYQNDKYTITIDENNPNIKYIVSRDTKYTMLGTKIYANVKEIVSDDVFNYIVYNDGTAAIERLINSSIEVVDFNNLQYKITNISAGLFANTSIKKVILPNGMKALGDNAFNNCKNLEEVVLPEGLLTIGKYAFNYCTKLKTINIPNSVQSIGAYAFYQCSNLEAIIIPEGVTIINSNTFADCYNLKSVIIPSTVKKIEYSAFRSCNQLKDIMLSEGLERIEGEAFAYTGIIVLDVPASVTYVGNAALRTNGRIIINHLGKETPDGWDDNYYRYGNTDNTNITIVYNNDSKYILLVTNINMTSYLYTDVVRNTPTLNGNYDYQIEAWYDNPEFTGTPVEFPYTAKTQIDKLYPKVIYNATIYVTYDGFNNYSYSNYGTVTLDVAPQINKKGFYIENWYTTSNFIEGTEISFPFTFKGTDNNRSIYIYPKFVEYNVQTSEDGKYEYYVFNNEMVLSKYLGDEVNVDLSGINFTKIGNAAFRANKKVQTIVLPNTLTTIEAYAFTNCNNLKSINIPNSVKSIGEYAFYQCSNLVSIVIPEGVTTIEQYTFNQCYTLKNVKLPSTLKIINYGAFCNCNNLVDAVLPEGLERIENEAFTYTNIQIFDVPESVTYVGQRALYSNGIVVINHSGKESPTDWATNYCADYDGQRALEVIYKFDADYILLMISDSSKTRLYKNIIEEVPEFSSTISGWYDNPELTGTPVEFPYYATENITKLYPKVSYYINVEYYNGNYTNHLTSGNGSITIDSAPSVTQVTGKVLEGWYTTSEFKDGTKVEFPYTINATTGSVYITLYPHFVAAEIKQSTTNKYDYFEFDGKVYLQNYYGTETDVDLTTIENLVSIHDGAFKNNTNLKSVIMPNTVTTIGNYAFSGCTALTSITFSNAITSIGNYAFYQCRSLNNITLPETLTSIGSSSFSETSSLESIIIPTGVKAISNSAFSNSGIKSVTLSAQTERIGSMAFASTQLTSINLPNTLKRIESYAFDGSRIKMIVVPDSVTNVEYYGLYLRNGLVIHNNSVDIPDGWDQNCYGDPINTNNPEVICGNNSTNVVLVVPTDYIQGTYKIRYRTFASDPTSSIGLSSGLAITGWYTTPEFTPGTEFANFTDYTPSQHIEYLYAKVEVNSTWLELRFKYDGTDSTSLQQSDLINDTSITYDEIIALYGGMTVKRLYLADDLEHALDNTFVFNATLDNRSLSIIAVIE